MGILNTEKLVLIGSTGRTAIHKHSWHVYNLLLKIMFGGETHMIFIVQRQASTPAYVAPLQKTLSLRYQEITSGLWRNLLC